MSAKVNFETKQKVYAARSFALVTLHSKHAVKFFPPKFDFRSIASVYEDPKDRRRNDDDVVNDYEAANEQKEKRRKRLEKALRASKQATERATNERTEKITHNVSRLIQH